MPLAEVGVCARSSLNFLRNTLRVYKLSYCSDSHKIIMLLAHVKRKAFSSSTLPRQKISEHVLKQNQLRLRYVKDQSGLQVSQLRQFLLRPNVIFCEQTRFKIWFSNAIDQPFAAQYDHALNDTIVLTLYQECPLPNQLIAIDRTIFERLAVAREAIWHWHDEIGQQHYRFM